MRPRGGVVTQRAANPCTAGSSPARGLQHIGRHMPYSVGATLNAENITARPPLAGDE